MIEQHSPAEAPALQPRYHGGILGVTARLNRVSYRLGRASGMATERVKAVNDGPVRRAAEMLLAAQANGAEDKNSDGDGASHDKTVLPATLSEAVRQATRTVLAESVAKLAITVVGACLGNLGERGETTGHQLARSASEMLNRGAGR